ncbi:MAG: hypothetical protein ACI8WT_000297 [Clostridium sp.]|jgi:hypothetical protein
MGKIRQIIATIGFAKEKSFNFGNNLIITIGLTLVIGLILGLNAQYKSFFR